MTLARHPFSFPTTSRAARATGAPVDETRFVRAGVLAQWQRDLAARGVRRAGSPAHDGYVADLANRLTRVGVSEVRIESVLSSGAPGEPDTFNVIGLIPGASDELVALHARSDGHHGESDNGAEVLLAVAGYLTGLPRDRLPRGVVVLLSSGPTACDGSRGVQAFLDRHHEDLVPRIATGLHLAGQSPSGPTLRRRAIGATESVLELAATSWTRLRASARFAALVSCARAGRPTCPNG